MYRVARWDAAHGGSSLHFAALQGETARRWLPPELTDRLPSVVLLDAHGTWLRSEAVCRTLARLRVPWRVLALLRWLPQPWRDGAYDWVAARRGRLGLRAPHWPGRLTPVQQARFLP